MTPAVAHINQRFVPTARGTATAWVAGGATWLAAGLIRSTHGIRFDLAEGLWIAAHSLIFVGLLGLRGLQPAHAGRTGSGGLRVATAGRVVFIAAEVLSLIQQKDQNGLLPLGALLTAVGMSLFGVAVIRRYAWRGVARFCPLAMGLYPFAVMFPLLAASGGKADEFGIALWGAAAAAVGVAVAVAAPTPYLPSTLRVSTVS